MTINKYCWCCCPGLCEGRIENMRYWWVHNSLHWFKNLMTRSWWQPALVRGCNSVIASLRPSHKMPAQLQIIQQEQSSIPRTGAAFFLQDVSNLWSHYETSFIHLASLEFAHLFSWIPQPRMHQSSKSLWPSSRGGPEDSKTPPTCEIWNILSQVMAI